jgi:coproporphyrinogen III oxidase
MQPLDPASSRPRLVRKPARFDLRRIRTIEAEAGSDARFDYLAWDRTDPSGEPGGGGVRGVMKGKVFEKVGVNVSTVGGIAGRRFRQDDPRRGRGSRLLRHRHQPGRAHGQPACAGGAYEHALPVHHQALVRRRRGPQPADSL